MPSHLLAVVVLIPAFTGIGHWFAFQGRRTTCTRGDFSSRTAALLLRRSKEWRKGLRGTEQTRAFVNI